MAIFLNNDEQEKSITPASAMDALAHGIRQLAEGNALRRPRVDNLIPTENPENYFSLSSMEGGIRDPGYFAVRLKSDIYGWVEQFGKKRRRPTTRGRDYMVGWCCCSALGMPLCSRS
jgi:hypothetical protein